jgi:hypothetical protein
MRKITTIFYLFVILVTSCGIKKNSLEHSIKGPIKKDIPVVAILDIDSNSRNSADFPTFIRYFLHTCYYNNNIDSLLYSTSPLVNDFIHKDVGFGRYWNQGASCNLFKKAPYNYPFYESYFGETCNLKDLELFNKKPVDGFCEDSKDTNGAYYYSVTKFPDAWDMGKNKLVKVNLATKFNQAVKMEVDVMVDAYIAKQFYFAQINNTWYLVFIDDCNCSA